MDVWHKFPIEVDSAKESMQLLLAGWLFVILQCFHPVFWHTQLLLLSHVIEILICSC